MGSGITRLVLVLALAVAPLGVLAAGAEAASQPVRTLASANQLESEVLGELNKIRHQHGLAPLRLSKPLASAADAHSRAMGTHGFFDHSSRDGSEFWKRVQRFYDPSGYSSWSVGENLLWSSGRLTASDALALWMKSPGHRKNILTARWREIGLSALSVRGAPGVFGGRDVVIVTTDFGVRS
ncbi:MAG: CAP domain-containing protein [Gaiellaceae bacterium]